MFLPENRTHLVHASSAQVPLTPHSKHHVLEVVLNVIRNRPMLNNQLIEACFMHRGFHSHSNLPPHDCIREAPGLSHSLSAAERSNRVVAPMAQQLQGNRNKFLIRKRNNRCSSPAIVPAAHGGANMKPMGALPDADDLRATAQQRASAAAFLCTASFTSTRSFAEAVQLGLPSCAATVAMLLLGYVLADGVSGVFHWAVDNYGSDETPAFGPVIDAFQGHHKWPFVIAQRDPCNNLGSVSKVASVLCAAIWCVHLPPAASMLSCTTVTFAALSQQSHAWSHCKASSLPPIVRALQDTGVLVGRAEHGVHHKSPHAIRYSIVSGWTNYFFDNFRVFQLLELLIVRAGGPEPRCWALAHERTQQFAAPIADASE